MPVLERAAALMVGRFLAFLMEEFSADCTAGSSDGFLAKIISKALNFTINGTCLIIR